MFDLLFHCHQQCTLLVLPHVAWTPSRWTLAFSDLNPNNSSGAWNRWKENDPQEMRLCLNVSLVWCWFHKLSASLVSCHAFSVSCTLASISVWCVSTKCFWHLRQNTKSSLFSVQDTEDSYRVLFWQSLSLFCSVYLWSELLEDILQHGVNCMGLKGVNCQAIFCLLCYFLVKLASRCNNNKNQQQCCYWKRTTKSKTT